MPPTEYLRRYPVIKNPTARSSSGQLCVSVYPSKNGLIAQALVCRAGKRYQKRITLRRPSDGKILCSKKKAYEELGEWVKEIRAQTIDVGVQTITRRSKNRPRK